METKETNLKAKKQDYDTSFTTRFLNFVKRSDIFGYSIRLNYEGEDTYKTTLGGFLTLFTKMGIALFLLY
jgi:hypothetical protein